MYVYQAERYDPIPTLSFMQFGGFDLLYVFHLPFRYIDNSKYKGTTFILWWCIGYTQYQFYANIASLLTTIL